MASDVRLATDDQFVGGWLGRWEEMGGRMGESLASNSLSVSSRS